MNKIHISQIYSASKVTLGAELYYICELGKYIATRGDKLSIKGIILSSELRKSPVWEYFRLAVKQEWIIDSGLCDADIISVMHPLSLNEDEVTNIILTTDAVPFDKEDYNKRQTNLEYAVEEPLKLQISFESQDDNAWLWSLKGKDNSGFNINNKVLGHNLAHQRFVSLIAFVAINRLYTGSPVHFGISLDQSILLNRFTSLSYMLLLADETICLNDWFHIVYNDNVLPITVLQAEYSAWYQKGRDLGMLNRWYNGKEKLEYCKKLDIQAGDIVMLYQRIKSSKLNMIKSILSCHIVRIDSINSSKITFTYLNTTKLKHQGKVDFDNQTTIVKSMYCGKLPYTQMNYSKHELMMADCGVEYMLYNELYFILPLDECDDEVTTLVSNGVSEDKITLPQNEFIYWLLEDYNVKYNKERFLKKYFKSTPLRDLYFAEGKEDKPC